MEGYAFEVYGVFGRVYNRVPIPRDETHHAALQNARESLLAIERWGKRAWIRLVNAPNAHADLSAASADKVLRVVGNSGSGD